MGKIVQPSLSTFVLREPKGSTNYSVRPIPFFKILIHSWKYSILGLDPSVVAADTRRIGIMTVTSHSVYFIHQLITITLFNRLKILQMTVTLLVPFIFFPLGMHRIQIFRFGRNRIFVLSKRNIKNSIEGKRWGGERGSICEGKWSSC